MQGRGHGCTRPGPGPSTPPGSSSGSGAQVGSRPTASLVCRAWSKWPGGVQGGGGQGESHGVSGSRLGRPASSESMRGCPVSGTVCGEVSGGRGLGRTRARPAGPAPVAECPGQASPPLPPAGAGLPWEPHRGQGGAVTSGSERGVRRVCPDLPAASFGVPPGAMFPWEQRRCPGSGADMGTRGGGVSALPEAPCCPVRWELVSPSSAFSR